MLISRCAAEPRRARVCASTQRGNPRETLPTRSPRHESPRTTRGCALLAIAAAAILAPGPAFATEDWKRLGDETAALLGELIRVDTQNPPGGETAAAHVLARTLEANGIASEVIESSSGRGNLHARIPGGPGRPIVLLAHLDVVPADARAWRVPPFAGERRDGYVWGRGALDAKGVAAVQTMAAIAIQRSGRSLGRDVVLLATADEETGGRAGAGWITEHRPDLVRGAEYIVTEGDHIHERADGQQVVQVAVAEKTPCWVELRARGDAGHGSAPPSETAVTRLVRALERIREYETPVRVVPAVAAYFAALAPLESTALRERLGDLAAALADPAFRKDFTANQRQNALVRNTITPTVLAGSIKTNVIPSEASAQLDCRLLPGEHPDAFLRELREVIGDGDVEVRPLLSFPASASDSHSSFVVAVGKMAEAELGGAPVVPSVITGFTDSHYFRDLGIASYGFVPFVLNEAEQRTVHGVDERVSLDNLRDGVRRLVAVLRALSVPAS
jgi:acetylornithine deacetylase/succinyl-diaminopimelate desuccinylase-like protein